MQVQSELWTESILPSSMLNVFPWIRSVSRQINPIFARKIQLECLVLFFAPRENIITQSIDFCITCYYLRLLYLVVPCLTSSGLTLYPAIHTVSSSEWVLPDNTWPLLHSTSLALRPRTFMTWEHPEVRGSSLLLPPVDIGGH